MNLARPIAIALTLAACLAPQAYVGHVAHAAPPTSAKKKPAAPPKKAAPAKTAPVVATPSAPVGLPQDAGPHDAASAIEWWYFNTFLTTAGGHHYAVIGAFFRTGLTATSKGHYLIYALADLDAKSREPYALIDHAEINLLKAYLSLAAVAHPDDPKPLQLIPMLEQGELPPPLRIAGQNAVVQTTPLFGMTFDNASIAQQSSDGRTWKVNLNGADWTLDLTLDQPVAPDAPPMLVGGAGLTGLTRPDDMHYLSLTRMKASGTLTDGGEVDKVTGVGWLDRQWGTSWIAQANGWDWFGLHLDDGSELIVYRVRDSRTGKILRTDATLLSKEGAQTVETAPVLTPETVGYQDPDTRITFPQSWTIALPKLGLTLTTKSAFPEQTMPVIGIGDAIWEGVVNVTGTRTLPNSPAGAIGAPITGRGYMELVGYRPSALPAVPPAVAPAVSGTPPPAPSAAP